MCVCVCECEDGVQAIYIMCAQVCIFMHIYDL